jgi:uncharacterized protein YcgL (UPF0745 family)
MRQARLSEKAICAICEFARYEQGYLFCAKRPGPGMVPRDILTGETDCVFFKRGRYEKTESQLI